MSLDQIDQLAIVKTNLALLRAIRIDELDESAHFAYDRIIAESLSIVEDVSRHQDEKLTSNSTIEDFMMRTKATFEGMQAA